MILKYFSPQFMIKKRRNLKKNRTKTFRKNENHCQAFHLLPKSNIYQDEAIKQFESKFIIKTKQEKVVARRKKFIKRDSRKKNRFYVFINQEKAFTQIKCFKRMTLSFPFGVRLFFVRVQYGFLFNCKKRGEHKLGLK